MDNTSNDQRETRTSTICIYDTKMGTEDILWHCEHDDFLV